MAEEWLDENQRREEEEERDGSNSKTERGFLTGLHG